jgi:hypothetical protein
MIGPKRVAGPAEVRIDSFILDQDVIKTVLDFGLTLEMPAGCLF